MSNTQKIQRNEINSWNDGRWNRFAVICLSSIIKSALMFCCATLSFESLRFVSILMRSVVAVFWNLPPIFFSFRRAVGMLQRPSTCMSLSYSSCISLIRSTQVCYWCRNHCTCCGSRALRAGTIQHDAFFNAVKRSCTLFHICQLKSAPFT